MISAFVVARLIGPAEVGVGAAAVSVHVLLWVGVNALFADPIVQRPSLSPVEASSAFWSSCAVGVIAAVAQAGGGWPLAASMGDRRLVWMSAALACALPLVGAAGVVQGTLVRDGRYRLLAFRTLAGQGLGTVGGIALAMGGAGAWSLVGQQAVTSAVGALVLLAGAGWRPLAVWRADPVREMVTLGGPLTASTLVMHGRYRLFAVLVGSTAGASALGQLHMAFRLVDTLRELACTAMWRLMLPSMAERQRDRRGLLACADRWLAASTMVLFPLCAAMLVTIEPVTRLVLGPVWAAAGSAALPLLGLSVLQFLLFPAGVALVATGFPWVSLQTHVVSGLLLAAGCLVLSPSNAEQGVALWVGAQGVVAPYMVWRAARLFGVGPFRLVRAGLIYLGLTAASAGCGFLVVRAGASGELAVGGAAYLLGLGLTFPRGMFRDRAPAIPR